MSGWIGSNVSHSCACMGPQNGEPLCPCQMRGMIQRDGKWIRPEQVIGDVIPQVPAPRTTHGCICPAGAEKTCAGPLCPRRPWSTSAA